MNTIYARITIITLFIFTITALAAPPLARADEPPLYVSIKYSQSHAKGFILTPRHQQFLSIAPRVSFSKVSAAIPGQFSMRGLAGPVEDQGQCGSCWDFSLTSVLRGTWIMSGEDPGRLSFNYLLNCDSQDEGCNGGDFTAADYLKRPLGAPLYGSDGPYIAQDGVCVHRPAAASAVNYHLLGPKGSHPSFKDIAYVVGVLHRPVSIDVAVDDNWENYGSGVYNGCSDESENDLNHMVAIEGYDCEGSVDAKGQCVFDKKGNLPHGLGVWIIRNSWSASWGEDGYMRSKATDKRGRRCNAVATDALYFDP